MTDDAEYDPEGMARVAELFKEIFGPIYRGVEVPLEYRLDLYYLEIDVPGALRWRAGVDSYLDSNYPKEEDTNEFNEKW